MPPTLVNKFLIAAKDLGTAHAVLLPDGFRFSPAKTRRDWTNECRAELREFYAEFTSDGRLPLEPYLTATVRYREELAGGKITLDAVAAKEKLNPKYLRILSEHVDRQEPVVPIGCHSPPLAERDAQGRRWSFGSGFRLENGLWKFVPVGSYRDGNTIRQVANDPAAVESQQLKSNFKLAPGQAEVVLYLTVARV